MNSKINLYNQIIKAKIFKNKNQYPMFLKIITFTQCFLQQVNFIKETATTNFKKYFKSAVNINHYTVNISVAFTNSMACVMAFYTFCCNNTMFCAEMSKLEQLYPYREHFEFYFYNLIQFDGLCQ